MTLLAADAGVAGAIAGDGRTLIVEHTTDNTLVTFRFEHADVKMLAAEEPFEAGGPQVRRRRVHRPGRRPRDARAVDSRSWVCRRSPWRRAPSVKTHDLDVPRIGYVHAWQRTQDEGWVRLAFDTFGVPYTYFADQKLREGNLRAKYDVIVYPACRRLAAVARQRSADDRQAAALQEDGETPQSRRARRERRHPRRHGPRRPGESRRSSCRRAAR